MYFMTAPKLPDKLPEGAPFYELVFSAGEGAFSSDDETSPLANVGEISGVASSVIGTAVSFQRTRDP